MNLVLCGMPGAGKSSVGREIALLSGRKWVDTDEIIASRHGAISSIFEIYGEAHFRALETEVVKELSAAQNLVVSTGGGLVLRAENVELLKRSGKIVYLRTTPETLVERVGEDGSRPLLAGNARERLQKLLSERAPIYESVADDIVDTDGKSVYNVAEEVLAAGDMK